MGGGKGVLLGATAVSVNCGGFGVLEGLGVLVGSSVGSNVSVGAGNTELVGIRVKVEVG